MILEVDADQSGEIEFPEFLQMMTGKMASGDTKEETMKVYKMFDTEGAGKIDFHALKKVAKVRGAPSRTRMPPTRPSPLSPPPGSRLHLDGLLAPSLSSRLPLRHSLRVCLLPSQPAGARREHERRRDPVDARARQ